MRRKIALIMAFTLIFSIVFNMNSGISVTVNALSGGPRLIDSNIRDGDEDVSVHKTFVLTFNIKIEIDASMIKLFNQDSFRMEAVRAGTDGDSTLTIEPRNSMEAFSDYQLILERDSVTNIFGDPSEEISIFFVTEKEPGNEDDKNPEKERTYGQQFGQIAGRLSGYTDFLNNRKFDWERVLPSDRKIISEYNLNRETEVYRNSFLVDFEEGFKKGYEEAFRNENFGIILSAHTDGAAHGQFFGSLLGEIHGRRDFYNDRTNDWTRWLPSDRDIISEYNLSNDDGAYSESFVYAFKNAYRISYTTFFRLTNAEDSKIIKENGMSHGQTVGGLAGETQGKLDYMAGKDNDWRSSLPADDFLIETYNLIREHVEYMEGFLVGYKQGYREAYIRTFQDENMQVSAGNLNTAYISMHGGIAGSFDGEVGLYIEPGSIYTETALTIAKLNTPDLPAGTDIIPATASYNIKVQNTSNIMDLKRPIVLEFRYYGSKSAGIYELKDGKWFYLHSTVEDGRISTIINTSKYSGGTYAVLIDERYEAVDDIAGHWAVKPIETFLKRNYVNGYPDRTFRPEQSITRAEFVKVLDNVYNWDKYMPYIYVSTYFADSSVFGIFANSISKAASLGYVRGYEDNTFRPHVSISYQEVEWLMQRITGRPDFKWDTVAEKILTDYYVRPKSYNSKQNYITRGEVVYLLYLLEEGLI
jgi:hypothetical protein